MSKHHKILRVERDGPILILVPQSNGFGFRYSDVQVESNGVRRLLGEPDVKAMIVDLGVLDYFGSEIIGAIVQIARHASDLGSLVALCNGSEKLQEVLQTMNLAKLWPYFDTREEAVAWLQQQGLKQ